ncbi:amidase [Streptomyces sp. I05A-00742]|uniref:amidase n=1 Tax=Streptomyces sp. I05A-00742 TaxID=2732853 RepID=UPI001BB1F506|nr:amidase [Streptomyces sp. I05A-00742]
MGQPFATLSEMAHALRSGTVSSKELVTAALADADRLDPLLGVYVSRFPEAALDAARRADALPAAARGPLHGLPLAVKDNFATVEGPATAQSPAHEPAWWHGEDAPAVGRLRAAGAVVLGKTTMAEYAMGRPDPAHAFPVPRNPWDPDRWTGGSSTGNGAGIASGLFLGAIGTDTSGSLRLPAALCGTTGLKPTYGLVEMDGCIPLSPSQDVAGPMGVSAQDCALLLAALTGRPYPRSAPAPEDVRGLRVGVPYELLDELSVTEDCRSAFVRALDQLRELGAEIREFPLPEFSELSGANGVIMLAEAFGEHGTRLAERWEAHGRAFRRLAALGALLPAHLYLSARRSAELATARLLIRMSGAEGVDVIATPTWPAAARPYHEEVMPGGELNLTGLWNPTGFPALALPMGATSTGLPLSLQLIGRAHSERTLLDVGVAYQTATTWHLRRADPDPERRPLPLPDPERDSTPFPSPAPSGDTDRIRSALTAAGLDPSPADLAAVHAMTTAFLQPAGQPAAR